MKGLNCSDEVTKSFTAKTAKGAKKEKSFTAKDANPRRKSKALPRRK